MRNLKWIPCVALCLLFAESSWSETVSRLGVQTLAGDSLFVPDTIGGA